MVYNYTTPRVPIAGMFKSPGPCYGLPGLIGQKLQHDPRSVHSRGPAYPLGIRHGKTRDECSPGPAYKPSEKVYRSGKDGIPAYSMSDRRPMTAGPTVPGPGAYSPEKNRGSSAHHRAPAYTFRARTAHARRDRTPAPNAYHHDPMVGKTVRAGKPSAPTYTMVGKRQVGSFCQDLSKTPGPGAYGTTYLNAYKSKSAAYSMVGRTTLPGDTTVKPGPGAHSPEKTDLYVKKKKMPAYTFGIRHSQYTAPLIIDPVS